MLFEFDLKLLIIVAVIVPKWALCYDVNDRLWIGGNLVGVYQYQNLIDADDEHNGGRGVLAFKPEASYKPNKHNELFVKLGFAAGHGLSDISPFIIAPYAGDAKDTVRDINGRGRDYLLTAWYKHTLSLSKDTTLGFTGGIIDATDYIDHNEYANDENTQFMNEALVNGPNGFFPSYDYGGALEFNAGNLSINGVVMSIGENDDGNSFGFYALQMGYTIDTGLGQGTYRIIANYATEDFLDETGNNLESRIGMFLSFDQQLGDTFGAFLRLGWQDNSAAINHDAIYSGGININGTAWGRAEDNVGIGYAYLYGGNLDIDHSQVYEMYAKFQIVTHLQLTLDFQYMEECFRKNGSPKGFIYGVRLYVDF